LVLKGLESKLVSPYNGAMPRHARLDAPGALHHVIGRGIEGAAIFRTDSDRGDFLNRIADLWRDGALRIYAWALLPTHFHLLVRTAGQPLAKSMRQLLTGYVVNFNHRYRRFGHLFQNRYKSIVCEDEPYLLELTRYIHLNPLRAGLVRDLEELRNYPWSGHSAITGHVSREWQDVVEILARFDAWTREAVRQYEAFVLEGVARGRRPELVGGGFVRSAGGWAHVVALRRRGVKLAVDERVLGGGEFAERLVGEAEERVRQTIRLRRKAPGLDDLAVIVVRQTKVSGAELRSGSKARRISSARKLFCQIAVNRLGHAGADVARFLGVGTSAVNRLAAGAQAVGLEDVIKVVLEPTSP
jgi:putative transposase